MPGKLVTTIVGWPFNYETDQRKHKNIVRIGFWTSFVYSIIWGVYEYYIMKSGFVPNTIPQIAHWAIMHLLLVVILGFATKFSIEQMIMGQFFMAVFEDMIYFITYGFDYNFYPYPAGNWWDYTFASFRVLGGLGQPVSFWPYTPIYYIPGFAMIILFYVLSFIGPKTSRIGAWIVIPLYLAVLIGTMVSDLTALIILIVLPIALYLYLAIAFIVHRQMIKKEKVEKN